MYNCTRCGYSTDSKSNYDRHMLRIKPCTPKIENYTNNNNNMNDLFSCEYCGLPININKVIIVILKFVKSNQYLLHQW